MKHLFLSLLPLAAALCACTAESDGPPSSATHSIAFRAEGGGAGGGAGTRGEISSPQQMAAFKVWGWADNDAGHSTQEFAGTRVERRGGAYSHAPPVYWMPDHTYHFLAFATSRNDADSGLGVVCPRRFTTWPQAATASLTLSPPYDEDILYAHAERQTTSTLDALEPVSLSFRHALARLKVQVRQASINGYHVRLRSLSFTPHAATATLEPVLVAYSTEIPPATVGGEPTVRTTYDVELTVASTTPATAPYVLLSYGDTDHPLPFLSQSMLLVPAEAGTLQVDYELWMDSPSIMMHQYSDTYSISGTMQAGHSYQANIMLPSAQSVITLQGTIEPWGDDNDTDREILSI